MGKVDIELVLGDKRPKIQLPGDNRLLSDFAGEVGKAVRNADIFTRAGMVVTVNERGDGLQVMTPEALRTWLEQYAVCYKVRNIGGAEEAIQFRRTMTTSDAQGLLSASKFISQLRPIVRVNPLRMPILRRDGWIELLPEGYDDESATLTATGGPPVVDKMPLSNARQILDEMFSEFCFADTGRSKAVALAAMLTVYGFHLLPPGSLRPCFVY